MVFSYFLLGQFGQSFINIRCNLSSPWYSWKIAHLALNNNHLFAHLNLLALKLLKPDSVLYQNIFYNRHWLVVWNESYGVMTSSETWCRAPDNFTSTEDIYSSFLKVKNTVRFRYLLIPLSIEVFNLCKVFFFLNHWYVIILYKACKLV